MQEKTLLRVMRRLTLYTASVMCLLRKLRLRITANVEFGERVFIERGVIMRTFDGGKIFISNDCHIWHNTVLDVRGGTIKIAQGSLINCGCYIAAYNSVDIGSYALIAEYVTIRDAEHNHKDSSTPFAKQGMSSESISISDNVWVGAKSTITKGVSIGPNVIVGANSVVTKPLAADGTYAGAPAKKIN